MLLGRRGHRSIRDRKKGSGCTHDIYGGKPARICKKCGRPRGPLGGPHKKRVRARRDFIWNAPRAKTKTGIQRSRDTYRDPQIAYLRRQLAKWRGHCRCVERQGATMKPPLSPKREHEARPLCSACGRPRKR